MISRPAERYIKITHNAHFTDVLLDRERRILFNTKWSKFVCTNEDNYFPACVIEIETTGEDLAVAFPEVLFDKLKPRVSAIVDLLIKIQTRLMSCQKCSGVFIFVTKEERLLDIHKTCPREIDIAHDQKHQDDKIHLTHEEVEYDIDDVLPDDGDQEATPSLPPPVITLKPLLPESKKEVVLKAKPLLTPSSKPREKHQLTTPASSSSVSPHPKAKSSIGLKKRRFF